MWLVIVFIIGLIFVPYLAWYFFVANSGNVNVPGGESIRDFLTNPSEKRDEVMRLGARIILLTTVIYCTMWAIGYYVKDENKWYYWAATQTLFVLIWNRLTKKLTGNQIYVIGGNESEFTKIKEALHQQAKKSIYLDITHLSPDLQNAPFFRQTNNAIICTTDGVEKLTPHAIGFLRSVTEKSTCRIYLKGVVSESRLNLFEDFIQRTNYKDDKLFEEIIEFLKKANSLARTDNLLGARDIICLKAYKILKWFWNISYFVAFFYVINTMYYYFTGNTPPWEAVFSNKYVVVIGTFFGLFFSTHAVITIARNSILALTKITGKKIEFLIGILLYALLIGIVLYSVFKIENSLPSILISAGLALFSYWLYMYSLRIRGECSSLSEIFSMNSNKRNELINKIGRSPFPTGAFPLVAKKTGSVFISNMHKSSWSKDSAESLFQLLEGKYKVFLDRESINSGDLWRRYLLRNISECTFFVVILDDGYLDSQWVLAESIYAALLRKNVAKPRILLVFQNIESKDKIKNSPYGYLYKDIFEIPEHLQIGSGMVITFTDDKNVTAKKIINALDKIKPMQLL